MLFGLPISNIIVDLAVHAVINITVLILLLVNYANIDTTGFSLLNTLNAASIAFSIGGLVIDVANIIGEGLNSEKKRLENEYFNFLRNLVTSFCFVLVTLQNGKSSEDLTRVAMWLLVVQRLVDVGLDVDTPWTLVCDNMEAVTKNVGEQSTMLKGRMYLMKQLMVVACFGAIITTQLIYSGVSDYDVSKVDLSSSDRDDDFYMLMVFILVGLHLLLVLINLALGHFFGCKKAYMNLLLGDPECEGREIYGLNSIPVVTKIVFTANLFFLGLLAGEHMEDDKNIGWLIYSSIALAVADMVARNII